MTQPNATREGQKTALTECEAAFKKSNEAGEHPANAEAWRAFRAGWHGRAAVSETGATVAVPVKLLDETITALYRKDNMDSHSLARELDGLRT